MKFFWKIFLRIKGWRRSGEMPGLQKYIIIVGPHTSNHDFILGLAFRSTLNIGHSRFLGKDSLFKPPFRQLFIRLGGIPVYRGSRNNMVQQVAELFRQSPRMILALSPEGTRKRVDKLRTGFYQIALAAGVPIVMVGMDYPNKILQISDPFFPSGNQQEDFDVIYRFYQNIRGRYPEQDMSHLAGSYITS